MIVDKIHWLASYPKSGNTWVRSFLNAYKHGALLLNDMDFVQSDNKRGIFQLLTPMPVDDLTLPEWARMRGSALKLMMRGAKFSPLILKTHNANATIDGHSIFPDECIGPSVYVIRDPRDVVPSFASHMGMDIPEAITQMASNKLGVWKSERSEHLPQFMASWHLHARHWVEHENVIVVRYEDMLADPHREFRRVLSQFGLVVDESRLDAAIEATRFDKLKQAEDAQQVRGFAENSLKQTRFFRTGKAGKWREILTRKQAREIEAAFREEMIRFGYELAYRRVA